MNRDYFNKPIQNGGRSAHDYGHTSLHSEDARSRWGLPFGVLLAIVLWAVIAGFAGEYILRWLGL